MTLRHSRMKIAAGFCAIALSAVALASLALFAEDPARQLEPDEQVPERIVLRQHPKLGGRELVTLTSREAILEVMTALPSQYSESLCACFGLYELDFHGANGIFRTVSYKPGFVDGYVRDSAQPTGQSAIPRRFKRIVGGLIDEHRER